MKKIVVFVLVLFLTTTISLSAQSYLTFGLKGGISLSHGTGDDWDWWLEDREALYGYPVENKMKLGFSAGGFFL